MSSRELMLGIVNKAYAVLVDKIPEVEDWPHSLHLIREGYHSGLFEGNECRRLLRNINKLESIIIGSEHYDYGAKFSSVQFFICDRNSPRWYKKKNRAYKYDYCESQNRRWYICA